MRHLLWLLFGLIGRLVTSNFNRQESLFSLIPKCALWNRLSEGGEEGPCGWLKDKFGVSWQIVPAVLGELLNDPDPVKSQRVVQAMLQMDKIDIKRLEDA